MRPKGQVFILTALAMCLACTAPVRAQRQRHDPLTPAQVDKIREAGIAPQLRLKLYAQFVDEHLDGIKRLTVRAHTRAWEHRMDSELQNLTALMDELGSNLDQYADRKADIRKALKSLTGDTQRWKAQLKALPPSRIYDLSLKEAIASVGDISDDASESLKDQTQYFKEHKDQQGQEWAEPQ